MTNATPRYQEDLEEVRSNIKSGKLNDFWCYDHTFLAPHLSFIQMRLFMRLGCRFIQQALSISKYYSKDGSINTEKDDN